MTKKAKGNSASNQKMVGWGSYGKALKPPTKHLKYFQKLKSFCLEANKQIAQTKYNPERKTDV